MKSPNVRRADGPYIFAAGTQSGAQILVVVLSSWWWIRSTLMSIMTDQQCLLPICHLLTSEKWFGALAHCSHLRLLNVSFANVRDLPVRRRQARFIDVFLFTSH